MKKILMVASSGGHLEELTRLKKVVSQYDCCWVTEKNDYYKYIDDIIIDYYTMQMNRKELLFIVKFIILYCYSFFILSREKPDFVLTTGALVSFPFCTLARIFGTKVIFIESFARVHELSLTGKLLYRHANKFIVQWPELADKYDKAVLGGGIF